MENRLKEQIAAAAREYAISAGWANNNNNGVNQLAQYTKVNASYLSHILRFDFTYVDPKAKDPKPIADRWFKQLADAIGFKIEKEYWPHVDTPQFKEIDLELRETLQTSATRVLICESGSGKTYTIERFKKENPNRVFIITCNRFDSINSLIDKILDAIGKTCEHRSTSRRLTAANVSLHSMGRFEGQKPMLIFDEAENLTLTTFQMLKAMYDTTRWSCAIVLIGTDQLIKTMDKLKAKDKQGIPQFYRRFKAGIRYITPIDRSYDVFLRDTDYPAGLKNTLRSICENYGELSDFLVPALWEADQLGVTLTEEHFRLKYNLPIRKK